MPENQVNGAGGGEGGTGSTSGGGGDDDAGEAMIISDPVLAFMHSWYQGNNHQEIVKLALSSFTVDQLTEATKLLYDKYPEAGKFISHRDTTGRSASEMFAECSSLLTVKITL